ncbi:PREDICTED: tubulin-folding cofactor B [Haliaeetus leucocephalus]|uniref:tubulin-folding cofactor B n=1 Tax=Haliaeetus leucocephalus TaxID=52644 RepID=UPI00053CD41D|nr:PREDICTED: tubulin-folding cofactor B [Haliaeetus leucocephalus]
MKAAAEAGAGPGLLLGTGSVSLVVSSSLNAFRTHKRYSTGLTVAEFKGTTPHRDLLFLTGTGGPPLPVTGDIPVPPSPESLRSFLRQRRWGRYDTEGTQRRADEQQQRWAQEAALAAALPLGARCQVRLPGQPSKLATIMYVGQTDFKPGYWVGVRYDEPLGKHDGSVGGRRYFECQPKYGAFVKPQSVTPGDFPEEDNGLEDEL